jgi:micrococcal nuclease
MHKEKIILILLIVLLFAINYSFLDRALINFLDKENYVKVDRIIDGDTIVVGNESVRLLGINSPEKGEVYFEEAKEFLTGLVLNKNIRLEIGYPKYDKYQRVLAFIFISHTNINIEVVRWGWANVYVLENKKYEKELRSAWAECIEKNINLCEKSEDTCANCIKVKKFEGQIVVFENICGFDCSLNDWTIKNEGRKKYIFRNFAMGAGKEVQVIAKEGIDTSYNLFWDVGGDVWTKTGDTLFLRDSEGKLVLWTEY